MIKSIAIENFKSIDKIKMDLGRITVLIGENGSGKTNILEAVALASAAADNKLDNEFLVSRGIRVSDPKFMRSAFVKDNLTQPIMIDIERDDEIYKYRLQNDNNPYSKWNDEQLFNMVENSKNITDIEKAFQILIEKMRENDKISEYLIYSPQNPELRLFEREGQIEPLGINGEGLFKLLKVLSQNNQDQIEEIKSNLRLIGWFKDFEIPQNISDGERVLRIKDKYLDKDLEYFDQKSSNEGFLFLLFYFTLFISDLTPKFFAIDNIDTSFNPKLCTRLIKDLVELSKKHDKQAILTTHNPAILDGLNLDDEEQKLFVVFRNKFGHTKISQVSKPVAIEGQEPVKLSEAFLRGYIGGLPKGF